MPEPSYPALGLQKWAAPLREYIDSADDVSVDLAVEQVAEDIVDPSTALGAAAAGVFSVALVAVGGAYPPRPPEAVSCVFVGAANPEAFMEDADYWINLAEQPPLNAAQVTALINDRQSAVGAAVLDAARAANTRVFLSETSFGSLSGAPNVAFFSSGGGSEARARGWLLDPDTSETIGAHFLVPPGWSKVDATILWTPAATPTGGTNVRLGLGIKVADVGGGSIHAPGAVEAAQYTRPASAPGVLAGTVFSGVDVTAGALGRVVVTRHAQSTADDLGADIAVVGVLLERAA